MPDVLRAPLALIGLFLPRLLCCANRFPLARTITQDAVLLLQMLWASLAMFGLAHGLAFRLQLPSRYTHHSFRVILALAAGITLILLIDSGLRWILHHCQHWQLWRQRLAIGGAIFLSVLLITYPAALWEEFPKGRYKQGKVPPVYEFFAQQPKNILIASLSIEADFLPSFSHRSILVSREYAIPYSKGYYQLFRQRAIDLIRAQYSPNLELVKAFIKQYGIDFMLLESGSLTSEYIANSQLIQQYQPIAADAQTSLEQGVIPALQQVLPNCSVLEVEQITVLEANCILAQSPNSDVPSPPSIEYGLK